MRSIARFCLWSSLATFLCFQTISCSKNSAPTATTQPDTASQTESSDPAQANFAPAQANPAPVSQRAPASQQAPVAQQQSAPASYPAQDTSSYQLSDQAADQTEDQDSSQPPVYADQPPPPIPQYSQPECPGPNYLWTPGTWDYASVGYYWVPGVWVMAPFVGALWTPSYWSYDNNRYRWHRGYWGSHIGFYGGVNYGYGYVGRGYEGGYWNRDHFAYNRTVNNINVNVVKNVYNYRVTNITNVRTSYVGGRGGLDLRPTLAELAVLHERRIAPLPEQVQHIRQAQGNRAQFAAVNHGRPEIAVAARPLETAYRAPAARPAEVRGAKELTAAPRPHPQPNREPARAEPAHPEAARPEEKGAEPVPPQNHPLPAARTPVQPVHPRQQPPQQHEERAAPERRPTPEARPAPEPNPEPQSHPLPRQARPEPQTHSEPQARPEQRSAPHPEARPEPRPEPRPAARPEPKKDDHRPPLAE